MWIAIGIGGVTAYLLMRLRQKDWEFSGEPRSGFHAGQALRYAVRETPLKHGVRLRVGVELAPGVEFRIAREGLLSRLLRRARVGREVQTGLANFDDRYEVQSEDARLGPWLRESTEARTAITQLFNRGCSRIVAHRGHLWAEGTVKQSGALAAHAAAAMAASVQQLADSAPPARSPREIETASLWSRAWLPMLWSYGWLGFALFALLDAMTSSYPLTVEAYEWGKTASGYALLLSPVLIWLAARWMRDSMMARVVLVEFILVGSISSAALGGPLRPCWLRYRVSWAATLVGAAWPVD